MSLTRKKRPIIHPNPGFQKQLFDYEKRLKQGKINKINAAAIEATQPQKQKNQDLFGIPNAHVMMPPRPLNKFVLPPKTVSLPKTIKTTPDVVERI